MGITKVTFVRHGETEWNVAMRLQGIQDSALTDRGILQARQAAGVLRHEPFDRILSSDLQRAYVTAGYLNEGRGLPHETHTCLRERGFGIMEGLYREEIQQKYPETYQAYMQRDVNCPIPGGESLTQFYNRVITGVNELTDRYSGEQLLVVTHGGVLDCMIRMIFKYPLDAPRCFTLYNASINTFTRANGQWKLTSWGMVGHQNSATASIDEPGR